MEQKYKTLKLACYSTNISMSIVGNLSPILFLSFHSMYGISYTLLGFLVLINFITQLTIDLIFSFFSHKFNIEKTVKITPVIAVIGFIVYASAPILGANVYAGLAIGTVIFSVSSGLAEVLISPVIAAIPSKDPDREMSKLHSIYAWGVVFVVIVSTFFLLLCGKENWQFLALFFALVPLTSAFLFAKSDIPAMQTPEKVSGALQLLRNKGVWLCVFSIFLGGAAECTMAQWCSGYIEAALGIPKIFGDIFGVAAFAMMLGMGRTMYANKGKNIEKVILLGAIGATACYIIAAVSPIPVIGLLACAFTGFCVSMLWPGNLVIASERFPGGGVFIYAMMAAGGDLGASMGPQLIGAMTDAAAATPALAELAQKLALSPEQMGMKIGMLCAALFPIIAIITNYKLWRGKKTNNK